MKKSLTITIATTTLFLLLGCETGVDNKHKVEQREALSGIIDHSKINARESSIFVEKGTSTQQKASGGKATGNKIFSKSAQPGFYLQYAVFEKYRPTKAFLRPLKNSSFNYIVLNKYSKDYVLIGPYKSYNEAHSHLGSVKKYLHKQSFVVQVLRP